MLRKSYMLEQIQANIYVNIFPTLDIPSPWESGSEI